jgi:bleomycin hydrolase
MSVCRQGKQALHFFYFICGIVVIQKSKYLNMKNLHFLLIIILAAGMFGLQAQEGADYQDVGGYRFSAIKEVPHTPVRDQHRSGTCWAYAGVSFLEAEVLRLGGPEVHLSDMWAVRDAWEQKGSNFIRMHGKSNFGPGGEPHQVMTMLTSCGMVTEAAYPGVTFGDGRPVHGEMDNVLAAFVKAVQENKNRKLSPVWLKAYNGILDAYLGEVPETFEYVGKEYTPVSFAKEILKVDPNNYMEITSFSHHKYYDNFLLRIPDNWDFELYYNVMMEDLTGILDLALNNGYSAAWTADVSNPGFNHKKGLAIVPENEWDDMTAAEKDSAFAAPVKQKIITPEMRQETYDNYTTTDDHIMHIIGLATDQNGDTWYKVKNSWGTDSNDFGGYFWASRSYILLNTIALYVSKDMMPSGVGM